jgi:hypothetical protein
MELRAVRPYRVTAARGTAVPDWEKRWVCVLVLINSMTCHALLASFNVLVLIQSSGNE